MLIPLASAGVAAAVSGYAYAANWPTSQIFGRTLIAAEDPSAIALTFDDGPNDPYTPRLLETLARHNVRATFFLIGRFVRERPAIAREIRAAGHVVGNHTMTHPVLLWASPARVREELAACSGVIEDALGEPVRYFRPPHGARRPDVLRAARALGLTPVMWNAMGLDWRADPPQSIVERVERKRRLNARRGLGSNVLLHDGGQQHLGVDRSATLMAVESLLETWRGAGVRLITVEQCADTGSSG